MNPLSNARSGTPNSDGDDYRCMIREVLGRNAALALPIAELGDHDDLYEAGMTSFDTVNVMLSLEEAFDVELPESALNRQTFRTIASLCQVIGESVGST